MLNSDINKVEHIALAFSPEFHKSRLRLIYFSGIGGLLTFFEINPDSSLFGISFQDLTAGKIALMFLFLNTLFFVDHIIRLVEEGPITREKYRSAYHRYLIAAEALSRLARSLEISKESWNSQLQKIENLPGDCFDALQKAAVNDHHIVLHKILQQNQTTVNLLKAHNGDLAEIIPQHNHLQHPPYIPGKMGVIRLWIELVSGISAYFLFLWFAYGAEHLPEILAFIETFQAN